MSVASSTLVTSGSWLAVVAISRCPVSLLYPSQPHPDPCVLRFLPCQSIVTCSAIQRVRISRNLIQLAARQ